MHRNPTSLTCNQLHLIYPEREAIFLPFNQSYRGVGIYGTADEARQTNGHIDDRWHVYHAGRIYSKTHREKEGGDTK